MFLTQLTQALGRILGIKSGCLLGKPLPPPATPHPQILGGKTKWWKELEVLQLCLEAPHSLL